MNLMSIESVDESAPSRSRTTPAYLPLNAANQAFGTKYIFLSITYAAIVEPIRLALGLYYKNDCPIDGRIPTYMIVAGICGLAFIGLLLLLTLTLICFVKNSSELNTVAGCGICLSLVATTVLAIFVLVCFILGCVWVFSVRHTVQYKDPGESNYCHPVLYKAAMVLLLMSIVGFVLQCCLSCFRSCCSRGRNQ